jgi:hypothetical protein
MVEPGKGIFCRLSSKRVRDSVVHISGPRDTCRALEVEDRGFRSSRDAQHGPIIYPSSLRNCLYKISGNTTHSSVLPNCSSVSPQGESCMHVLHAAQFLTILPALEGTCMNARLAAALSWDEEMQQSSAAAPQPLLAQFAPAQEKRPCGFTTLQAIWHRQPETSAGHATSNNMQGAHMGRLVRSPNQPGLWFIVLGAMHSSLSR